MRLTATQLKQIGRFAVVTAASFIVFEAVEHGLEHFFGIEMDALGVGWLAAVIAYGFKTHIICCLVPLLWAAYRCRHRGCEHDHCKNHDNNGPEH
jgi:hypothetical protein